MELFGRVLDRGDPICVAEGGKKRKRDDGMEKEGTDWGDVLAFVSSSLCVYVCIRAVPKDVTRESTNKAMETDISSTQSCVLLFRKDSS